MAENLKVDVKKYILHILDNGLQMPVMSVLEHPEDDEIKEFLEKHIAKALKDDDLKNARFLEGESAIKGLCERLGMDQGNFVPVSQEMANNLFRIMKSNVDIPSSDLACCLFEIDGLEYFALLKFNYKVSYIHYVDTMVEGNVNRVVKQKAALPLESQRVEECAFINLEDYGIRLLEKKYEINGEKIYYFSNLFLGCSSDISEKQKVQAFKKATEAFNKEYFEEEPAKAAEVKAAVAESLDRNEAIHVEEVAEKVFRQNPSMQEAYRRKMEEAGFDSPVVPVSEKLADRAFRKQRIRTDTGVEISLPVSFYNEQRVEFINNVDGTISILIKNAGKITGM